MRRAPLFVFPLAFLWASCTPTTDAPSAPRLSASIADAVHAGNANFYWLPPLVPAPSPTGAFDGALSPVVTISEGIDGPAIAEFTMLTGSGSETLRVDPAAEAYVVNWHTDLFNLSDQVTYRIRVRADGIELGHADVDVVSGGRELKNVATDQFVALVDGRTLPIKFRIEQGAIVVNAAPTLDPIPDPAPIPQGSGPQTINLSGISAGPGETQTLTVTATSSNPALVPHPTVTYTSPNPTGSLTYQPAAGQSGSAVITVTVTDDGGTANGGVDAVSHTFTVVVTPVVVTTVRWINPDGGDWNTPSNWSTGALPTADQDVIIDIAVTNPVTHSAGTTEISSLTSTQADLSLAGGSLITRGDISLDVPGSMAVNAVLDAGGNILLIAAGNLTLNSVISAETGALSVTANGSITQVGGSVTAGTALLFADNGITLTSGSIGNLEADNTTSGNISITGLTGASNVSAAGVTNNAAAGDVMLATTGALALTGDVTVQAGRTVSLSGQTISQTGGDPIADILILTTVNGATLTNLVATQLAAINTGVGTTVLSVLRGVTIVAPGLANSNGSITLNVLGGSFVQNANVNVSGTVTLDVNAGSIRQDAGTFTADHAILRASSGVDLANTSLLTLEATNTSGAVSVLDVAGSLNVVGTGVQSSGVVTIATPGNLTLTSSVTVFGSTANLTATGGSVVSAGGTVIGTNLVLNTATGAILQSLAVSHVTATNTLSGALYLSAIGSVTLGAIVNPGGTVTIATGGNLVVAGNVNAGSNTVSLAANDGAIDQTEGTLTAGMLAVTAASGITLGAGGGTLAVAALEARNTQGAISVSDVGGDLDIVGTGVRTDGAVTLSTPSDLTLRANVDAGLSGTVTLTSTVGAVRQVGGGVMANILVLTAATGVTLPNLAVASLSVTNATAGAVSVTNAGPLAVMGLSNNNGPITLNVMGDLSLNGNVTSGAGATTLTSTGLVSQSGGLVTAGALVVTANHVASTLTTAVGSLQVDRNAGGLVVSNTGDLTIIGTGINDATGDIALTTTGLLSVSSEINATGFRLSLSSANLTINAGIVAGSTGTIQTGNFTNAGLLSVGAGVEVTVAGAFRNTSGGGIRMQVGGAAEFSRFTITGAATLGGVLQVSLIGGFAPAPGDRFRFMTFGSRSGFFDTTTLPPDFTVDQSDPTALELVVL